MGYNSPTKAIVDAKRSAILRVGNQIAIAARGGTDPALNSKFGDGEKAKAAGIPSANIQRAIDRVADRARRLWRNCFAKVTVLAAWVLLLGRRQIIVIEHCQKVKTALVKNGGRVADAGSVMFQFTRRGVIAIGGRKICCWRFGRWRRCCRGEDGGYRVYKLKDLASVRNINWLSKSRRLKMRNFAIHYNTPIEIADKLREIDEND